MQAQKKGPEWELQASRSGVAGSPPEGNRRSSVLDAVGRFERARFRALSAADGISRAVEDQEILERLRCDPQDVLLRAGRVRECSTWLRAREYFEDGEYKIEASRCRQSHLCQPCAIVRGSRAMSALLERLELVRRDGAVLQPYLFTFTVKDGPDVGERYHHLRDSFSKALDGRRVRSWTRGNSLTAIAGGMYSIEVKRGKRSGLWHPHGHAIVFAEEPLPVVQDNAGRFRYPAFSEDWKRITGDSFIAECHPIYAVGGSGDFVTTASSSCDLMGAVCEVCKYAVKFSSLRASDLLEAWQTLRGRRMVEAFGCFRGIKLEGDDDSFDFGASARPFIEYEYRWRKSGYSVKRWHLQQGG